jgi:hypothetical protein
MYRGTLSQHREGSPQAQVQAALLIPCGKIRFGIKIEVKGINKFFRDPTSGVTEALADLLRHLWRLIWTKSTKTNFEKRKKISICSSTVSHIEFPCNL